MGNIVPTSMVAASLSRVTVRGAEMTLVSLYVFKKESVAVRPSASRNAVAGLKPLAVSKSSLGKVSDRVLLTEDPGEFTCKLFPKERRWFWTVPVQSMPLAVLGVI